MSSMSDSLGAGLFLAGSGRGGTHATMNIHNMVMAQYALPCALLPRKSLSLRGYSRPDKDCGTLPPLYVCLLVDVILCQSYQVVATRQEFISDSCSPDRMTVLFVI